MNQNTKSNNGATAVEPPIAETSSSAVSAPAKKQSKKTKPKNELGSNGANGNHPEEMLDSRELLRVLSEVRNGNFAVRMPVDSIGLNGKICDTLNEIISLNELLMLELTKANNTIGKQGKLNHRVQLPYARGSWNTGVDSINGLISDLVHPTIEIALVIFSVAKGNLSQEMPLHIVDHVFQG